MLKLNVDALKTRIEEFDDFQTVGPLDKFDGIMRASVTASVGELCKVELANAESLMAEVIGFDHGSTMLMPLRNIEHIEPNANVIALGRKMKIPVGEKMLGRTINAMGNPFDGKGDIFPSNWEPIRIFSPSPMSRPNISQPFFTGQRAIDGMLSLGKGQRVGLFAGSGVGKSTLLGEIAKKSSADINVVALVGERGREVKPFIEECLGDEGMARSIVVVATGDEPALVRIRAAQTAITIASWFRDQGGDVLLMIDSLTRMAIAQREIGLMLGEPPTASGYPPSALQLIANLMEPLGCSEHGSITGLMNILVTGDDSNEPVADTARGVLDGHITLDRKLAEANHYPAINIGRSISRLMDVVADKTHVEYAGRLRNILQTYDQVADLIRIGMYQQGSSERIDAAIVLREQIVQFLRQRPGEFASFDDTKANLFRIAEAWQFS
jgi:flagellum-specific ATP synthase